MKREFAQEKRLQLREFLTKTISLSPVHEQYGQILQDALSVALRAKDIDTVEALLASNFEVNYFHLSIAIVQKKPALT